MNFKTTLILLAALVIAGVLVAVDRFAGKDKNNTGATGSGVTAAEHKLLDVAPADITAMSIIAADGGRVDLKKADNVWRLTSPVDAPADAKEVSALINSLVDLRSTGQMDAAAKASSIGLKPASFQVELTAHNRTTGGTRTIKVALGDKSPLGDVMYVLPDGASKIEVVAITQKSTPPLFPGDVAHVEPDVYTTLTQPAADLAAGVRDRNLVPVKLIDVRQVSIDHAGKKLRFQKQADASWQMVEPVKIPADTQLVEQIINAIIGLRAEDFVAKGSSEATNTKLDHPQTMLWMSTADPSATQPATAPATQAVPREWTVKIGRFENIRQERVLASVSGSPAIAKVSASRLADFDKQPIDLRDRKALDIRPEEVSRFTITTNTPATTQPTTKPAATSEVAIERRKEGGGAPFVTGVPVVMPKLGESLTLSGILPKQPAWLIAGRDNKTADESEVTAFLAALHPMRVDRYLEKSPATQPSKSYSVTLRTVAAGAVKTTDQVVHFVDRGPDQPLIGNFNGLTFEVARTAFSRYLEGDFKPKPPSLSPGPGGSPSLPAGLQ